MAGPQIGLLGLKGRERWAESDDAALGCGREGEEWACAGRAEEEEERAGRRREAGRA